MNVSGVEQSQVPCLPRAAWQLRLSDPTMATTMTRIPPILHVAELTENVFEDIREASHTYRHRYGYTGAFDELWTVPERKNYLSAMLAGQVDGVEAVQKLREWLLGPWSSARSLSASRLPQIGQGLSEAISELRGISVDTDLSAADSGTIEAMVRAFDLLDSCPGVGGTIASKMLSALRPDLFMIWDIPIARAYGFDPSVKGYRRFLQLMAPATLRMRDLWGNRTPAMEEYLKSGDREWLPPLTKFVDEWHWIRITKKHPFTAQ